MSPLHDTNKMSLTLASPFASTIKTRRPAQRSKSTASTLTWASSTGKVLRREISCRAEVNASSSESRSTPSISASVRIDFDMRQTVSLPPSPNLRESRKKPVDWFFDGLVSPPQFLSDIDGHFTSRSREEGPSLLSLHSEDSEVLSSGYASCDPSPNPAGFFEENDFLFPSSPAAASTSILSPSNSAPLFGSCAKMSPRSRSASLGLHSLPSPIVEPTRRRRWGSSSSSGSSTKLDTVPEDSPSREELSVLSKTLGLLVSAVILVYQKLDIVWGKKEGVVDVVVQVLKWLQPTILKRLSSDSSLSSFDEDLGFGLMDDSDTETMDATPMERDRRRQDERRRERQQRYEEKMDAAEDFGRRIVTSLGRQVEAMDVSGWLSRAKKFAVEHPIVTAGAGAAACTVAVPAVVAVTFVAAFLGIGFVGFLFVEGTLLTVGAIFVGSILLALGFVLLTIGIGMLVMYIGAANAYNIASAVWSLVRGGKSRPEQNGRTRSWGHHHHHVHGGHHLHSPSPVPQRTGHQHHRLMNGFVPNQLPRTVDENPRDEAHQNGAVEVKAE